MMFWNEENVNLYLVWIRMVGGDYLKKAYQKEDEAIFLKEQMIRKGYHKVWIQNIEIKKEKVE